MEYTEIINEFAAICKDILKNDLTGVYLHGSLCMGCFNKKRSDIDLLVVTENDLNNDTKLKFMEKLFSLRMTSENPIEMSIVNKKYLSPFVYPTPYDLHFSDSHKNVYTLNPLSYVKNMKGTDKDLAAHVTIINNYGITLCGKKINEVFSPVDKKDYIDSIKYDIENAKKDIFDNPDYIILNLCRVDGFIEQNLVLSKKQGGEWGIKNCKYPDTIKKALENYTSNCHNTYKNGELDDFAKYMLGKINDSLK